VLLIRWGLVVADQARRLPQLCQRQQLHVVPPELVHLQLIQPCQLAHHIPPICGTAFKAQLQLMQATQPGQWRQQLRTVVHVPIVETLQAWAAADKAAVVWG
jgi:hypothetical protein